MIRTVVCAYCDSEFEASRSDARRCKPCHKARIKEWNTSPRGRERRARNHRALRERAFAGYGGQCACCGESRFEFLALDHVYGGGSQDRKSRSTWQIAKYVVDNDFPPDFQVLCHNCNLARGWYGACPHEMEVPA